MRRRLAAVLAAFAAPALVVGSALGDATQPQPQQVQSASLVQNGLQLIWHVRLQQSFSPTAMQKEGRMLCLIIERAKNATVSGQLCVQPPRPGGRSPRLAYQPVTARGAGPAHVIAASVSRSSTRDLTASFLPSAIAVGYYPIRWQVLTTVQPPACTAARGCKRWFPAKPQLANLHTPQVVGCVPSGPSLVYHGPSNRRVVALTFDDGPWTLTGQFLNVLEREHVHATFFQIGEQVTSSTRGLERRILADGDMIGDHTWSHPNVSGDGSFAARQIMLAANAIRQATGGFVPCLFRAPGGGISSALVAEARSMGYTTIQWDIDPRDWALPGTGAIYSNVVSHAHPGAIVLQHDGGGNRSQTLAALPQEIATLRARGYQFVTVTELLGQRLIYK